MCTAKELVHGASGEKVNRLIEVGDSANRSIPVRYDSDDSSWPKESEARSFASSVT
jgi:hypothetical protein